MLTEELNNTKPESQSKGPLLMRSGHKGKRGQRQGPLLNSQGSKNKQRGFCKQQGTYALDGRLLVKKPTPQRQEANVLSKSN
jgi:hypothetical protein